MDCYLIKDLRTGDILLDADNLPMVFKSPQIAYDSLSLSYSFLEINRFFRIVIIPINE